MRVQHLDVLQIEEAFARALGGEADDGQFSRPAWPRRLPEAESPEGDLPSFVVYLGTASGDANRTPRAPQEVAQRHAVHRDSGGDVEQVELEASQVAGIVNHHRDGEALARRYR